MPLDERIRELEYLIPKEISRHRAGVGDYPRFWLATLYHETGNVEIAERVIRELFEEDNEAFRPAQLPWLKLYARILEARGREGSTLVRVRAVIERAEDDSTPDVDSKQV